MRYEPLLKIAPFSGTRVLEFEGFMCYLSTGDLQNESISFVDITYQDRPSRADITVKQGDVLFARMKGTKKVLEIDKELTGIVVSTGFAVVHTTNECNSKYFTMYLKSDDFERQKEKYCSGAIQPAITNAGINKIRIPLPPIDDQIRIATLLSKVENLISRRREQLKQLDELLKSVFLEMFGPTSQHFETWPVVEIKELAAKHKGAMRTGPFGSNLLHSEFSSMGDVAVMGIDNAVHNRFTWGDQRFITKGLFGDFNGKEISFYCIVRLSYPACHSKRVSLFDSFRSLETHEQLLLLTGFCCLFLPI
jgi:restriction endonuclease S subunit